MAAELEKLAIEAEKLALLFNEAGESGLSRDLKDNADELLLHAQKALAGGYPSSRNLKHMIRRNLYIHLFDYDPKEIALTPEQITSGTNVYIGNLFNKDDTGKTIPIFEKLMGVSHIYTADGRKIQRWNLTIGGIGKTADELIAAIENMGMGLEHDVINALRSPFFAPYLDLEPQSVDLVKLTVGQMDHPGGEYQKVFDHAGKLGLYGCDPRVAPYQRMADKNQKPNSQYNIALDPDNYDLWTWPFSFPIDNFSYLRLSYCTYNIKSEFVAEQEIVFSVHKPTSTTLPVK